MLILFQTSRTPSFKVLVFLPGYYFWNPAQFFLWPHFWAAVTSKRRLGHPNWLYLLNPEYVRTPWELAPKKFAIENFRVWSVLPKNHFLPNFRVPTEKKVAGSCALHFDAPTSHVASLNRHTPKCSGAGLKLTWCQPFGAQGLLKSRNLDSYPPKKGNFEVFFLGRFDFPGQKVNFCL